MTKYGQQAPEIIHQDLEYECNVFRFGLEIRYLNIIHNRHNDGRNTEDVNVPRLPPPAGDVSACPPGTLSHPPRPGPFVGLERGPKRLTTARIGARR